MSSGRVAVVLAGWCIWTPTSVAQQLSASQRLAAVATVWSEARYNYAAWDRVRADWDSALRVMLVQAGARQTDLLFLRRLRGLAALLEDPQAAITAPSLRNRLARPPLSLQWVDDRPLIIDYVENAEMRVTRPERLAEVVAVQGVPSTDWIRDSVLPLTGGANEDDRWQRATATMLDGTRRTAVHLTLRLPDGSQRGVSVTRSIAQSDRWPLVPPTVVATWLPESVVVVRLNSLAENDVVRRFDRVVRDWRGVRDLIIDLRACGEGDAEIGYEILARLVDRPFLTVRRRTRRYEPVGLSATTEGGVKSWTEAPPDTIAPWADGAAFGGRVVILASRQTAGAAEDMIAAFRAAGRGVVVGGWTAGVAGRAITVPLPGNWRFHLTATRHLFPDGTEFAGRGIEPDLEVTETVRELREGVDGVLERARRYLAESSDRGS